VFDLYLITPDRSAREILERAPGLLGAAAHGRVGVQLRSKQLDVTERRVLARELRELTRAHGTALLINGDLDLACEVRADGVQLPERAIGVAAARSRLGDRALIGASRHSLEDVLAAGREVASFVTLSPVFGVPDKGEPLGLSALADVARVSTVPVFALGGIDAMRASAAVRAGAHGAAVIREVWDSADGAQAVRALLAAIDAARGTSLPA
jgi:thiamine-phosphate pyrophosphorylase